MKKNYVIRIAALVLMCALVTSCFASSTFAKYTSGGKATAADLKVATWSITDGTDEITDTMSLTEGKLYEGSAYGTTEENATEIAPGTCGSLAFNLKNESDVDAKYSVTVTDTDLPAGIKLYTDSAFTKEITTAITGYLDMEETETITIYWNWAFTDTDETAVAGTDFDITATITVEQVD